MSLPAIKLDFVPPSRLPTGSSMAVLVVGAALLAWTTVAWYQRTQQLAGLQWRIEQRLSAVTASRPGPPDSPEALAIATDIATALATPWSKMLGDLEAAGAASNGDVALLTVEPDRAAGKVNVLAEARTLTAALAYIKRLQQMPAVRNALLRSHEIQTKVPERPVRVQITADWSQQS